MQKRRIICLLLIFAFFFFSTITFIDSLSPYVSFGEARTIAGTVQIKGDIIRDNVAFDQENKKLIFRLRDETGEEAVIVYAGAKPEGLEHATGIVAIGKYQNNQFMAEKLLVKCPTKYQGSVSR